MSQRKAAKALGVSRETVRRDMTLDVSKGDTKLATKAEKRAAREIELAAKVVALPAKRLERRWSLKDDLPVIGELKDCRQLSADHWQGIDANGVIIDVHGGPMPAEYIIRSEPMGIVGIVRLTHA